MDPEKLVSFLATYATDWSRVSFLTLRNPIARFELSPVGVEGTVSLLGTIKSDRQLWLHPKLLAFALVSIVLGLSINALLPGRKPGPDLLASIAIIFVFWLASGSVLHAICRLLSGKGRYLETLSVLVQISATLYVATSFLAFVVATLIKWPPIAAAINKYSILGGVIGDDPVPLFFVIGTVLQMIYVPLSLKPVHRFGWGRTMMIALLPLLLVWIPVGIYLSSGLLTISK
jgi:hypothetical protein